MDINGSSLLDREYLADLTAGDEEFQADLLRAFLEATPPLIEDLKKAAVDGDLTVIGYKAHTIKGSCRSIGANLPADKASDAEGAARNGDAVGAKASVAELVMTVNRLVAEIKTMVG